MTSTKTANTWTFSRDTLTVNGINFPATYSPAKGGDYYVFATVTPANGAALPVRLHITPEMPQYSAVVEAAKPTAPEAKPAPKATKPAAPEAKPAPKATKPTAPEAKPADALNGKGWNIVFDAETARTRVIVAKDAPETVRKAVEDAGFWWSPTMQSYNKKLTQKARRAALELAETLKALA